MPAEHPGISAHAHRAAPKAGRRYLRMRPIYARLAAVIDVTRVQECCQA